MLPEKIVLTGFMGTGKSTVGRLLAQRLGFDFTDTDAWIEAQHGRSIADIFCQDGEAAFRQMERAAARHFAGAQKMVIATGGRLMLDEENAALLGENGRVFCLTAPPEEILARLAGDERRPLLAAPDPAARVRELLRRRAEGYGRFAQVDTRGQTPQQVAEEIARRLVREG